MIWCDWVINVCMHMITCPYIYTNMVRWYATIHIYTIHIVYNVLQCTMYCVIIQACVLCSIDVFWLYTCTYVCIKTTWVNSCVISVFSLKALLSLLLMRHTVCHSGVMTLEILIVSWGQSEMSYLMWVNERSCNIAYSLDPILIMLQPLICMSPPPPLASLAWPC